MSDSYRAIFDAVRSSITNADIGQAVDSAIRDLGISLCFERIFHAADSACDAHKETAIAARAPHVLMRPTLSIDGNQWCALYGDDLVMGVAGFGDTPALAMADFDKNWHAGLQKQRKNIPELFPGSDELAGKMAALSIKGVSHE